MKKTLFTLIIIAGFVLSVIAQEDTTKAWKFKGVLTVTASQVSLSNWAAGGDEVISLNGLGNFSANYKDKKQSWANNITMSYGTQKIKAPSATFNKTDDKFEFSSKYGYVIKNKWFYSGILSLKTQMDKGYEKQEDGTEKRTSLAFSPAYLLYTVGIDYKPSDNFAIYTSPLTGKTTIVQDTALANAGAYGVDPGKNLRAEFGAYIKIEFTKDIFENVSLQSKMDLFGSYEDKFKEIDVNWDVLISMKINKFISANIATQLIYDQDTEIDGVNSLVQFKEVFGVGLTFKF